MPSDLNRPEEPVYRPSRGGMDAATKRLSIIAGSIGVILLALIGGWSLTNHATGGIPVIEPPAGPERVKPANPGGLQLMGAEPPAATAENGATALAPGPETPDPQALQAELSRARQTDEPAPTATSQPATSQPATSQPATSQPATSQPASPPPAVGEAASSPPPTAAPAPATDAAAAPARPEPGTHPAGHVEVQLAALDSEQAAQAEWSRLERKQPSLFAARTPVIVEASRDGKTFYRLRTGGFTSIADATGFCERSRAAGAACTIAAF